MEKMKELIKKLCTREIIFYAIFGVLTTIINIGSFYVLNTHFQLEKNTANFISITLAVLVAYFTNKDLVFHSQAEEFGEKVVEFCRFILGRLFTMAFEYIGCAILFECTSIPNVIIKCVITILVIILNFFISKFFAFKSKDETTQTK